ncbi:type VI secretion system baseplate subunit TssG [Massilia sp. 9096]|uniref:type VI secretion system baseplate subunit TssG n=1 Tax=Massilia sp. 9096 TaxID=1500894 RepID=UPI000690166E|nr:type VI secretion system baseplate subunit TssG [Massilia sp. 9096]
MAAAAPIARLLAEPQRFEFFQAVRLLLLWLEEQGVAPGQALERHLRFPNSLSLAFPASQVEALTALPRYAGTLPQFHLTPGFMSLLGAHGALPSHYTERIQAWQAHQADTGLAGAPRAFLDMFSTRMLALFYGAWRKYRVEHAIEGAHDAYLPLLLALAALPRADAGAAAYDAGVPPEALARYAGVLRQRPASAAVLGRVLADHFGVGVAVLEAVGHWDALGAAEQTRLGRAGGVDRASGLLGQSALLGARSWRPDLRVRVRIGPLDRRQFERFLPGGACARALRTLLALFAAPALSYEIVLVLRRDAVRPLQFDAAARGGRRLGIDSVLASVPAPGDRADMRYEIRPLAPLAPLAPLPPPASAADAKSA